MDLRQIIIDHIWSNRGITIGNLVDGADCEAARELLFSITITEIIRGDSESNAPPVPSQGLTELADTRTKLARDLLDARMISVVSLIGPSCGSPAITEQFSESFGCAPSADQLRKSLRRSIGLGLVKSQGKARGTTYTLTAKGERAAPD